MGISTRTSRQSLIFFTILLMLTGLFVSRALLSISMFMFLAACIVHKDILSQLKVFIHNPLLFGLTMLFLLPFISWFWSEDKETWWRMTRIKLPLLLFPVAFAGNWQLTEKHWRWIAYTFIALVFAGCCWSLWQYAPNMMDIHKSYLKAKVIPTPFDNDHVRFSLVVCIALLCAVYLLLNERKAGKYLTGFLMLFFAIFLHILSARTGLISLYILLFLGAIYLLITSRKTKWIIAVCIVALAMPLIAWWVAPTFQNRIRYFIYDLSYIRQETYLPGANDGNRILSMKAGWDIMNENPLGTGVGDIMKATNNWYDKNIHGMLETDKIYPSSEWLMYGAGIGWAGFTAFTIVMLLPFFQSTGRNRFFWIGLNAIIAFSFIFDIGLEVQFGVFIYVFIILWWWKWLKKDGIKAVS